MIEKFKQLNVNMTGSEFIRKFEWLGKIIKNKNDINLMELILSFQFNNKEFNGTDAYIAHRISLATSSINACLKRLEVEGFIIRDTFFNTKLQKKERTIKVKYDQLVNKFEALNFEQTTENPGKNPTPEVIITPAVNPITEVIVKPGIVASSEVNPTPGVNPKLEVIPTQVAIAPPEIKSEPEQKMVLTEKLEIPTNTDINEKITSSNYYKPGYEDFNVKKMLTFYLKNTILPDDSIEIWLQGIDKGFMLYLTKNKINRKYNLIDFANYMMDYDYDDKLEIIKDALADDINRIDKFELVA